MWRHGASFAAIRSLWLAHAAGLGGPIRIAGAQGLREGIFEHARRAGTPRSEWRERLAEIIEAGDLFFLIKDAAS